MKNYLVEIFADDRQVTLPLGSPAVLCGGNHGVVIARAYRLARRDGRIRPGTEKVTIRATRLRGIANLPKNDTAVPGPKTINE